MLYLTCTMISSVDHAYYRVSRAKDWISVDCGLALDCEIAETGESLSSEFLFSLPELKMRRSIDEYPVHCDPSLELSR